MIRRLASRFFRLSSPARSVVVAALALVVLSVLVSAITPARRHARGNGSNPGRVPTATRSAPPAPQSSGGVSAAELAQARAAASPVPRGLSPVRLRPGAGEQGDRGHAGAAPPALARKQSRWWRHSRRSPSTRSARTAATASLPPIDPVDRERVAEPAPGGGAWSRAAGACARLWEPGVCWTGATGAGRPHRTACGRRPRPTRPASAGRGRARVADSRR